MDKNSKVQVMRARNDAFEQYMKYKKMKEAEYERRICFHLAENCYRLNRTECEYMAELLETLCADMNEKDSLISDKYSL